MTSAVRFARFPALAAIDHAGRTRFVMLGVGILAAYLLLDFLSYVRWFGPSGIAPWNPAIGMSVALLIRAGWIYAIWLFPAAIVSEALIRHGIDDWAARVAMAAVVACVYAGCTVIFERVLRADPRLERLRDLVWLFVTAAGATAVMAFSEVGILVFFGQVEGDAAWLSLIRIWVGDMIGIHNHHHHAIDPATYELARARSRARPGSYSCGRRLHRNRHPDLRLHLDRLRIRKHRRVQMVLSHVPAGGRRGLALWA